MNLVEVKNHFGSFYRVCKLLGLAPQNMTNWKRNGYIPLLQQYRIAEITQGALMPDQEDPSLAKRK